MYTKLLLKLLNYFFELLFANYYEFKYLIKVFSLIY